MQSAKVAIDPLWQYLCPSWTRTGASRASYSFAQRKRPAIQCLRERRIPRLQRRTNFSLHGNNIKVDDALEAQANAAPRLKYDRGAASERAAGNRELVVHRPTFAAEAVKGLLKEPTSYLFTRLRTLAIDCKTKECREVAEYIVRNRRERPNAQLYSALILSNISHANGGAWRVLGYLNEMREAGLQPDIGICHAVLKVLAVHPDHLLQADILEYMRTRWYDLSEDSAHDVAAGLLRGGLFEQALQKIDGMHRSGVEVQGWLLDMAVYMLCTAGEVDEAYRLMRQRHNAGELSLSRTLWYTLLDAGSAYRHHASAALVWNSQVNTGYLNPASGVCLNVLTTASQAGDAVLATDVFTHLAKRGTAFTPIHYQLLTSCYLAAEPLDLHRALSILPIMALEKMADPGPAETRSLYLHLRANPSLIPAAFTTLRDLHAQNRRVPIAALNLIIECYVEQCNLAEALNVYKLIHTFAPAASSSRPDADSAKKSTTLANIETFNLLLRGCRLADPPDEGLASFLVSELLALRVKPMSLTYDRLILVFVQAAAHALSESHKPASSDDAGKAETEAQAKAHRKKGLELLDWAFRHFTDMQAVSAPSHTPVSETGTSLGWMPRLGTIESLATQLARVGDRRCWDVLQAGEDHGGGVDGWEAKGKWVRGGVEEAWRGLDAGAGEGVEGVGGW